MKNLKPNLLKTITLSAVWLWLILFVLLPLALIAVTSLLTHDQQQLARLPLTLSNYRQTFVSGYFSIVINSIITATMTTALCLLIGYPFAYIISQTPSHQRPLLLMLMIIPFWISSLIRTYAMMAIMKAHGLLNTLLLYLGLINTPLQMLYTPTAVQIGLVYNLLPFMILPLYVNLEKLDYTLIEAARDLGAGKARIFRKVIIPHSIPGIVSGVLMVFLPAMTLFYIPDLLGGSKSLLLGNLIQYEFLDFANWTKGSAISVLLIAITLLLLIPYWRTQSQSNGKIEL